MSETVENKPANTKLALYKSMDFYEIKSIRRALMDMPRYIQNLEYENFKFEMPFADVQDTVPTKETYINWRGKKRERLVYPKCRYTFVLSFSKCLSDEELRFWRIWKLGYICNQFKNCGI